VSISTLPRIDDGSVTEKCSLSRRQFVNAHDGEELAVNQVQEIIGRVYEVEADARDQVLECELLSDHRFGHAMPIVNEVYEWR